MPRDRLAPLPLPSLQGRTAIVTGASSGIGFAAAHALGRAGAAVVCAVRDPQRGSAALARLRAADPAGDYHTERLDTSSLASVRALADRLGDTPIDILIGNAGIGAPRLRTETPEGHELTLATNYLGHFLLTGLLLDNLRLSSHPRVVLLGSLMAHQGRLDPDDLELHTRYSSRKAYANSKLAMVMFARELQRRGDAAGWGLQVHAVHPGYAATRMTGLAGSGVLRALLGLAGIVRLAQSAADGAQPVVFAAGSPRAVGGTFYGPVGRLGLAGPPGRAPLPRPARDPAACAALWRVSIDLTGAPFPG